MSIHISLFILKLHLSTLIRPPSDYLLQGLTLLYSFPFSRRRRQMDLPVFALSAALGSDGSNLLEPHDFLTGVTSIRERVALLQ